MKKFGSPFVSAAFAGMFTGLAGMPVAHAQSGAPAAANAKS